jgi:type I restriction-modification system DNA methylase subunit
MKEALKQVSNLVDRFEGNIEAYRSPAYNETALRREFIDPFFEALGWDVTNKAGYAEQYKDVIHEDAIKVAGATKAPDYCFRIGGVRKFFLETKKPSVDIKDQPTPAYQLRRYAWSAKLPLSILTNFKELAIYDCRLRPKPNDKPSIGRIRYYTYPQYLDSFEEIHNLFSKESVLKGSFDKFVASDRQKRGTTEVDAEFLKEIEFWREALAKNIAMKNPRLSVRELNYAVQLTIDRIIFLRMCEDRGIEPYGQIQALLNGTNTYHRLRQFFYQADGKYNSGLFDFRADRLTPELTLDDNPLKEIFKNLYYPDSPYEFSVLSADILGHVYEQFLGKVIRLTEGHRAKVEEKPEVRKAGGVYYTPTYIVDYIVKNTVGKLVEEPRVSRGGRPEKSGEEIVGATRRGRPIGLTPQQISKIRILDPACGSGSFLLGAYQYLLDYHRDWYKQHGPPKHTKEIYQGRGGEWYLTTQEKKRILLSNIYGVDIDPQAVEVTKLSLLLKVLEGENQDTLEKQMKLFKERALPDLGSNIKCGNSLIGPDFYQGKQMSLLEPDEVYRVNPFDWEKEFPEIIKRGGFDAVISNPPYIRIQMMKEWAPIEVELYKQNYTAASKGNYDIYVVFVERGLGLLNKRGRLGFILPHKFFNAQYGQPLRALLSKGKHLAEVVHFGDQQVFTGATTYTCLLFLDKAGNDKCQFFKVDDLNAWSITREATEGTIPSFKITAVEWNFAVGKGSALFEKLSQMPSKLGDVADRIFQGIIPGADKVYTVDFLAKDSKGILCYSKALDGKVYLEPTLLRKIISGAEVGRFTLTEIKTRVIYPYITRDNDSMLIPPTELREKYPLSFSYFQRTKDLLDKRDRGSARGSHWYQYIRRQNIALQPLKKLAVPRLVSRLHAGYDENGSFCLDNVDVGGIILSDSCLLSYMYVLGLLNSKLLNYYFIKNSVPFRGGFYSANRQYIEKLPIRLINFSDPPERSRHEQMVVLVEQMLDLHKRLTGAKTAHDKTILERQIDGTDRQIDRLVYDLYGLTDEEMKIVEEQTK